MKINSLLLSSRMPLWSPLLMLPLWLAMPAHTIAAPSINDMQGCQAYLDFVDTKITDVAQDYPQASLSQIRTGLAAYNVYIQDKVIAPGLMSLTGNDANKSSEVQGQIDAYKAHIAQSLGLKYQKEKLLSDYAVAINECSKKLAPQGQDLQSLKTALTLIIELAQQ